MGKNKKRLNKECERDDGKFEGILGRGVPKILRLAMIYAYSDVSESIRLEHLKAAFEVHRYCIESTCLIFQNKSHGFRKL